MTRKWQGKSGPFAGEQQGVEALAEQKSLDVSIPVTIHLQVEDVDAVFERAVRVGAKIKMPLEDMFWGDRYGVLEDPFGHHWSVATHI